MSGHGLTTRRSCAWTDAKQRQFGNRDAFPTCFDYYLRVELSLAVVATETAYLSYSNAATPAASQGPPSVGEGRGAVCRLGELS